MARPYGHACAVAAALDVIGERWTLLVVRELLTGPKRFRDLLDGLPGIATDLLTTRLRDLEAGGLVVRSTLPPPAASRVYALTARGAALEPTVLALASWGLPRIAGVEGVAFRPHWLEFALRSRFHPLGPGEQVTVDFVIGDDRVRARLAGDALTVEPAQDDRADVVITGPIEALVALVADAAAREQALARGDVTIEGGPRAVEAVRRAFAGGQSASVRR